MTRRPPRPYKIWLVATAFVFLTSIAYWLVTPAILYGHTHKTAADYPAYPELTSTDRITIVAPHLDDETLGAGGLIATATSRNIPVSIIFMTNGDDFPLAANLEFKTGYPSPAQLAEFGVRRQKEAIKAVAKLGVAPENLYFLGLPDRGLADLRKPAYADKLYTSSGTLFSHSGYELTYQKGLDYTGSAAKAALTEVLNKTAPTRVFTTSTSDKHTDHASTGYFVQEVLPAVKSKPTLSYFLIHFSRYPVPKKGGPTVDLVPPVKLENKPMGWQTFMLEPSAIDKKSAAIGEYHTQLRVSQVKTLLWSLVRRNELFSEQ